MWRQDAATYGWRRVIVPPTIHDGKMPPHMVGGELLYLRPYVTARCHHVWSEASYCTSNHTWRQDAATYGRRRVIVPPTIRDNKMPPRMVGGELLYLRPYVTTRCRHVWSEASYCTSDHTWQQDAATYGRRRVIVPPTIRDNKMPPRMVGGELLYLRPYVTTRCRHVWSEASYCTSDHTWQQDAATSDPPFEIPWVIQNNYQVSVSLYG